MKRSPAAYSLMIRANDNSTKAVTVAYRIDKAVPRNKYLSKALTREVRPHT
jgi:hypothetical protein